MGVENDILFDVMTKPLVWYDGHFNRTTEERPPKKMLDRVSQPEKKRMGRPVKGGDRGC